MCILSALHPEFSLFAFVNTDTPHINYKINKQTKRQYYNIQKHTAGAEHTTNDKKYYPTHSHSQLNLSHTHIALALHFITLGSSLMSFFE